VARLRWLRLPRLPRVQRLLQGLRLWWLRVWWLRLRVYACDAVVLLLSHLRSLYKLAWPGWFDPADAFLYARRAGLRDRRMS
jgi:hypothetical protein